MRGWLKRLLILAAVLAPAAAASDDPARVASATAGSDGAAIARFTLHFSAPMAALGDPHRPAPASVDCPVSGAGRWIDPATWVWEFARPLPGGATCRASLRAGLKTLAGAPVIGPRVFPIDAGGPVALAILPAANDSAIEEDQTFLARKIIKPVSREFVSLEVYMLMLMLKYKARSERDPAHRIL